MLKGLPTLTIEVTPSFFDTLMIDYAPSHSSKQYELFPTSVRGSFEPFNWQCMDAVLQFSVCFPQTTPAVEGNRPYAFSIKGILEGLSAVTAPVVLEE